MDEFRFLPLGLLHESPQNPRRHWNAAAFADLVASVRQQGVLTPLLARPSGHVDAIRPTFEIAAGHRRFRAAKEAGLTEVPVRVRDMDDATFMEVLTIENLQREDVHPLDEADGYQALLDLDGAYSPEVIAAKVGKSKSYVYQRLKLRQLSETARTAFIEDAITVAHAVRLSRLTPELQDEALEEVVFQEMFRTAGDKRLALAPVQELDDWIGSRVAIDPASPDTADLFPEVAAAAAEAAAKGATILQLTRDFGARKPKKGEPEGPLGPALWREASGRDKCKHAQAGVIVKGWDRGTVLQVCVTPTCAKHFPPREATEAAARTSAEARRAQDERLKKQQEQWKREEARRQLWTSTVRAQAFTALAQAIGSEPITPEIVERVLEELVRNPQVHALILETIGGTVTVDNCTAALLLGVCATNSWSVDDFISTKIPQAYKVDVMALLKAAEKAQGKPATKKAAKKGRAA